MIKNKYFTKGATIFVALVMGIVLFTGCGKKADEAKSEPETKIEKTETKAEMDEDVSEDDSEVMDDEDETEAEMDNNAENGEAFEDIRFVDAFYANDGNGTDFMIVFYESKDGDIAYVNDGVNEAFSDYTVENATTDDGTEYILVKVGEILLGYYEEGEDVFLITEDGSTYVAGHLTEEEAEELHGIITSE